MERHCAAQSFFQLNFVVTQVLALVAAPILRSVLHPSRVSSTSRNGFVLFMGLSLLFYAFGSFRSVLPLRNAFRPSFKRQRHYRARAYWTVPTMLEYFSYMFQFHTLMAGPFVLYGDYTEFISGENLRKFM
ncbi:unnamed protein product, partial [Nesidiocoris tenuis]